MDEAARYQHVISAVLEADVSILLGDMAVLPAQILKLYQP